ILVTKCHKPTSSLRSVDESVDEGSLEKEPRFDDEEADIQRAVEESLKSVHDAPQSSLPPVVIREPNSGKFQPLPKVQGKGKEKVSDEQVARLTDSDIESDKEVPLVVEVEAQDEGQAGPNPGVLTEGQAGSDPGDDVEPQPQSSPVFHAGPNLEHMDLEATYVSTQLHPEQMDEGFTVTAYPNVQENLKLTVEEQTIAIIPVLSTEEPDNSLSMGDEHLNTIPATESDEVIKFSVEDLVLIPSESEGIPDTMCDVHLVNNPTPLEAIYHFEIVINSNNDYSSSDDDSLYNENIKYVEASPHDSELVSLEIEALKDNPTPSFEFLTKSSSTSPKSFLEETNTVDNSLPEFENFCFDLEEISSGSTTTHSDITLSDYEAFSFSDDHIEKISSGSITTHYDISLSEYDSFIFDLSNDQFPPTNRSDSTHEEFADELAHIISPPKYDCFYFGNSPDPSEWISSLNSGIRENLSSTTCVNLPVEGDHSPLLAYVVWIFLAYLTYPVIPPHLLSLRNEDTIFDPGI
nr:hypothetical protein [Tanacetum cinerariifolium]